MLLYLTLYIYNNLLQLKISMSTRLYGEDLLRDKFIDNPKTSVNDYLLGYVNSNPNVGVLESSKVIVRRNYTENDIVQIVSGGASGHEPAYAGYVGKGMLTAAIQGRISCASCIYVIEMYEFDLHIFYVFYRHFNKKIDFYCIILGYIWLWVIVFITNL